MIKLNIMPPAIIRIRKDLGGYGFARMFYVTLPANTTPHQLPHELVHVKQWWLVTVVFAAVLYVAQMYVTALPMGAMALSIGVHGGLHLLSKSYRFWAEAAAYRVSAKINPDRIEQFARMLYGYNTGRTMDQCRAALKAS